MSQSMKQTASNTHETNSFVRALMASTLCKGGHHLLPRREVRVNTHVPAEPENRVTRGGERGKGLCVGQSTKWEGRRSKS